MKKGDKIVFVDNRSLNIDSTKMIIGKVYTFSRYTTW